MKPRPAETNEPFFDAIQTKEMLLATRTLGKNMRTAFPTQMAFLPLIPAQFRHGPSTGQNLHEPKNFHTYKFTKHNTKKQLTSVMKATEDKAHQKSPAIYQ